jgi:hypothetical protein
MKPAQERWDEVFGLHDRSCPVQRSDEANVDYLRRLARINKRYIPAGEPIARVKFDHTLPDEVVLKFSEQVREAVRRNAFRTDNMQPGEIRPVMRVDENTGQKIREWIGPRSFVSDPQYGARPCRLVARINAPATTPLYQNPKAATSGLW